MQEVEQRPSINKTPMGNITAPLPYLKIMKLLHTFFIIGLNVFGHAAIAAAVSETSKHGALFIAASAKSKGLVVMDKMSNDLAAADTAAEMGDFKAVLKLTKTYAESGNAHAQYLRGTVIAAVFYMENYGKDMDQRLQREEEIVYQEAEKWIRKSAEQDYAPAQSALAGLYDIGKGVPQNNILSHMWSIISVSHKDEQNIQENIKK